MMQPRFSKIVAPGMMAIDLGQLRFIAALVAAAIGGFVVTLWVTQPRTPTAPADVRADDEKLGSYKILNSGDLIEAAVGIGLASSFQLRANIDTMTRINEREVSISGWLADLEGDATPLAVLVFVGGKVASTVKTQGERTEITRALGLAFGAEKNVAFQAKFACRSGEEPIVAGVGADKKYVRIPSPRCP
jgi:hypothetical protein